MFERSRTGAVNVLCGNVPLNVQNTKDLDALFSECLAAGQPRVVLDLEGVPLIDSAGLELLLAFQERCVERGGTIKLAGPTPLCRDILTVTEMISRFEVLPDRLAAVGSFSQ